MAAELRFQVESQAHSIKSDHGQERPCRMPRNTVELYRSSRLLIIHERTRQRTCSQPKKAYVLQIVCIRRTDQGLAVATQIARGTTCINAALSLSLYPQKQMRESK